MDFAGHFVAVVGGGIAGAEAATQLAEQGIYVALLEQNKLPYGKIETGLPKWHVNLRNQEEKKIDAKINREEILFLPNTRLGEDVQVGELQKMGFSAIILATGAWLDRPFPLPDIDRFLGRGLCYQNPFVDWFNRKHFTNYARPPFHIPQNTIIIGGGLASLDVAKIVMLEKVSKALDELGVETDLFEMEKKGIPEILKKHDTSLSKLGVSPCTLYYRRQIKEMPLAPMPGNANRERQLKVHQLRERILKNFQAQYLFQVETGLAPVGFSSSPKGIDAMIFSQTVSTPSGLRIDRSYQKRVPCDLVISSIGSIPTPIPGFTEAGENLSFADLDTGRISGHHNIFAVGNAVTGRGNIRESMLDGRFATQNIMAEHLSWDEEIESLIVAQINRAEHQMKKIADSVKIFPPLSSRIMEEIFEWATARQVSVGFNGDYDLWISTNKPPRLEDV